MNQTVMDASMRLATEPPKKVLSIDGGGVHGLSSLLILERIMEGIQQVENLPEVPKPCDRFDLIGGIGTGGIIAIMLGRLRMTVDESITAYKKLCETGFCEKSTTSKRSESATFSTRKLEAAIKLVIRENCCELSCVEQRRDQNTSTADTCTHDDAYFYKESCVRTAVLAVTKVNIARLPTIFRTYPPLNPCYYRCRVWEIARATSAAVAFFKPIKLGRDGDKFFDAAFYYNNPCEALIREAEKLFPLSRIIALSLGTGLGDVVKIKNLRRSMTSAFENMATSSKGTHQRLKDRYRGTNNYHRLDVGSGFMDVTLLDSSDSSIIAAHTKNYLHEIDDLVTACVQALALNGTNEQFLSDICVADPCTDKKTIESTKGGLLKDSYKWILSHNSFQQFRKESESQILWIKGDPGKGKTMLLCGIIDELTLENSSTLSYFFCQATSNRHNTATSVLRGLIYHLARCNPWLIKYVRYKYDYKRELFKNATPWHDLCDVLTKMVNDQSVKNVILLVDGLDECGVGRLDLLKFFTKPLPVKWIVSSRNSIDIEGALDDATKKASVGIDLEQNQGSISAAVNSYIKFKVGQLMLMKEYRGKTKMAEDMVEYLRANSNGTFLWVSLVCQELSHLNARNGHFKDYLESFPPGLEPLYRRMLNRISQSKYAQVYTGIIATFLVILRPITLEELHALAEGLETLNKEDVEKIIKSCASFLTVHDNVVSFVHRSAKEYILENALGKIIPSGIPHQHYTVFVRSLEILHKTLRRDIYGLQAPGCLIDKVPVHEPCPLAAIRYSCMFWVDHLCDSATVKLVSIDDKISAFFTTKYLQWLEALSLLHSISIAGRAMGKIEVFLRSQSQDLRDIIYDARRFLLSYGGIIEAAPLQVYVSALIFNPTNSLIRQIFSREEPDWIELKPKVGVDWDSCLQTLEGHDGRVTSVAFSEDGWRLASGSDDGVVKIWDATSSVCLRTLEGHGDGVTSVAFSNDGKCLTSGSDDTTVKIWDASSGTCLQTLEGHGDHVVSVAFSNDQQRLASGSFDRTIKIWNATSGACLQTLEGHGQRVTSVAFSNCGQRLVSGSFDKTVKIWDATSGTCIQTVEGHDGYVTSVAFSKDGQHLASGSNDKTVIIWDATSGTCIQTLEGHDACVTSVAFANDGQRLTSGSEDQKVKIWDMSSGSCLQTLEGHNDCVTAVMFSNDAQQLASGSGDKTISIWDANFCGSPQFLDSHDSTVTSVAFSNDSQQLATGSHDETVKIWDAASGTCLKTLEGHSCKVTSVAFSNDGQLLASGSEDKKVKIWDTTSGDCLKILCGHHSYVTSVVFSKDQRVASGSYDNTVNIWDITSGELLQTLTGHEVYVTSLVFSSDGQRLASGSFDNLVGIWDTNLGTCLRTLEGHNEYVTSVVFSSDGQELASESYDKEIKTWNTTSGLCLQTLKGHDIQTISMMFSKDAQVVPGPSRNQVSTLRSQCYNYSLSKDGVWIMQGQERVLWLPPSYRPKESATASPRVALGTASGRLVVIGFRSTGYRDRHTHSKGRASTKKGGALRFVR